MIKQLKAVIAGILTLAFFGSTLMMPFTTLGVELAPAGDEVAQTVEVTEAPADVTNFEAMTHFVRRLPNTYFAATTGFLDPEIELPVTIEIAVPAGSAIIWFGEPSGAGAITSDPRFDMPYQFRTEGGFDIYTAVVETHHQVQIEYNLMFSPVVDRGDGTYSIRMEYTPLTDLIALRLLTNLPAGSEALNQDLEWAGRNEEGENEYARTFRDVRAGELVSYTINYTAPRWMGTPNESRISDGLIVAVAAVALGLVVALAFVIVAKRRRAAVESKDWDDADYEDIDYEDAEE
ncbi:MAG: hypothetical protein FWD93_02045 [Coriobacteriia bacterium]|nr:hypothetical protein [Coriobacteriia bacterium]